MSSSSVILEIRVKPRSRTSRLERLADGTWRAELKAPPVDGKANRELVALVAREFGCATSRVAIKTGRSGRIKRVEITRA